MLLVIRYVIASIEFSTAGFAEPDGGKETKAFSDEVDFVAATRWKMYKTNGNNIRDANRGYLLPSIKVVKLAASQEIKNRC